MTSRINNLPKCTIPFLAIMGLCTFSCKVLENNVTATSRKEGAIEKKAVTKSDSTINMKSWDRNGDRKPYPNCAGCSGSCCGGCHTCLGTCSGTCQVTCSTISS